MRTVEPVQITDVQRALVDAVSAVSTLAERVQVQAAALRVDLNYDASSPDEQAMQDLTDTYYRAVSHHLYTLMHNVRDTHTDVVNIMSIHREHERQRGIVAPEKDGE